MTERPSRRVILRRRATALGVCAVVAAAALAGLRGAQAPADGSRAGTAASPIPNCRAAGRSLRLSGPRDEGRVIALTFDDGPSPLTPAFLDVLRSRRVPATFFVVGNQIPGREAVLRRMLATGSVLGNHTFTHANVAAGGEAEIFATQAAIRAATGYVPCLFRAPMNKHSPRLVREARAQGLLTVQWNDDSRDWSGTSPAQIHRRVISEVGPGGIVLMHDGGGDEARTLAALPRVIDSLRARGYRFVTVPRLLGLRAAGRD